MITFSHKGDFSKTMKYFGKLRGVAIRNVLEKYGREGVAALGSATPVDTGLTASSWYYQITNQNGVWELQFCNSHRNNGVLIAVILYYGHGTRNGGWVEGRDYINPAIQPLFDKMADEAWREVTKL